MNRILNRALLVVAWVNLVFCTLALLGSAVYQDIGLLIDAAMNLGFGALFFWIAKA